MKENLPMTVFFSVPNAQTQCGSPGTWNLEKLHLELKYFGRKLCAEARLTKRDKCTWFNHRVYHNTQFVTVEWSSHDNIFKHPAGFITFFSYSFLELFRVFSGLWLIFQTPNAQAICSLIPFFNLARNSPTQFSLLIFGTIHWNFPWVYRNPELSRAGQKNITHFPGRTSPGMPEQNARISRTCTNSDSSWRLFAKF